MNNRFEICMIVERSRLSFFQLFVLAQCFLCMAIDGYDLQAMTYVVPTVIAGVDTPKADAGSVFSISMLGMLIGSLVFGSVADRIGRRPVLVISPIVTAVLMYITAHNTNTDALIALRFLAGIAMGAIVPNIAALVMEYAPKKNRVLLSTLVSSGMVVGAIGGGCIAAVLVPVRGWQAVFNLGAIAPLCMGILMLFALPESLPWCVLRERQLDRVKIILTQIAPGMQIHEHTHLVLEEARASGLLCSQLFAQGRLPGTLLLWLINFMNMLCVYFLASWSPLLVSDIVHTPFQAVLAGASIWLGGLAGGWVLSWFVDRSSFTAVLVPTFVVSAITFVLLSYFHTSITLAYLTIAAAGLGILGGQATLNAMTASFYPTALRVTGTGWTMGLGRLGGICGPLIGTLLLHLQWSTSELLMAAAIPAGVTAAGIIAFSGAAESAHKARPVVIICDICSRMLNCASACCSACTVPDPSLASSKASCVERRGTHV